MTSESITDLLIALLPIVIFLSTAPIIARVDGAAAIEPWLAANSSLTPCERRPLYRHFGYGADEVRPVPPALATGARTWRC